MNMRNYMKKEKLDSADYTTEELIARFTKAGNRSKVALLGILSIFAITLIVGVSHKLMSLGGIHDGGELIGLANAPIAAASSKRDLISIPTGIVKANPFLPYRDIGGKSVSDVPSFELVEPPEVIDENSDAARVMDTIVSGILYDKYSPSAIINIEGNDYLVKKGDTVNNYKVLDIARDSVTVKLGTNTYKAGIGEILTEGTVNHNDVSNLSKKFGGERR